MRILSTVAAVFVVGPAVLMFLLTSGAVPNRNTPPTYVGLRVKPTVAPPVSAPLKAKRLPGSPTEVPPTPTADPFTPEMRAYVARIGPPVMQVNETFWIVAELVDEARRRPAALTEDAWRAKMTSALDVLKANGPRIRAYGPAPPEYAQLHALYIAFGSDVVDLADAYTAAIQERDDARFWDSYRHIRRTKATFESLQDETLRGPRW